MGGRRIPPSMKRRAKKVWEEMEKRPCKCCGKYGAAFHTINSYGQVVDGKEICWECGEIYKKLRDDLKKEKVRAYMTKKGYL